MFEKLIKYLKEDPDTIIFKKDGVSTGKIDHESFDAYAFTLEDIGFFVSKEAKSDHYTLIKEYRKLENYLYKKFPNKNSWELDRNELKYPGRFWSKRKIISFWKYPNVSDFNKIVAEIKKNPKYDFDNSWKVQVYDKKNAEILIPIDEYNGEHFDVKNIDKEHVSMPSEKKRGLESRGARPKKIILPKDMTMAQYNSMVKQESYFNSFKFHYFDE